MTLFIDTSNAEKIIVGLNDQRFESEARKDTSQKLLSFIEEILKKNNIQFKDLKSIEVNIGPGSFTGLRVGVSIANTIGWVFDIPVNGKDVKKGIVDIKYK